MTQDRLIALFAEGLNVPASRLADTSNPDDTPEWDSLGAMNVISLLEDELEVEFSTAEMMKMRSIGAVRALLADKGVTDL